VDNDSAMDAYFSTWSTLLRSRRVGVPTVCVDLERVKQNAALVKKLAGARAVRISDKSVASIAMLALLREQLGTSRHMVFHLPFIEPTLHAFPDADILMGKPMPSFAIDALLETSKVRPLLAKHVAWLIDSEARLRALAESSKRHRVQLRVNLEIDVGLHRGGFALAHFDAALDLVKSSGLILHGLMGYDAHVGKSLRPAASSLADAQARYRAFVERVRARDLFRDDLVLNGAGSPTFFRHDASSPLNEISVGSIFLKPCDYDLKGLEDFVPAAFIATPVLKVQEDLSVPDHPILSSMITGASGLFDASLSKTVFHYGGRWDAKPVYPPGLREHPAFSGSFNQGGLSAPKSAQVSVDDYIFYRPLQTESVLLRFGAWLCREGEQVTTFAPLAEV
jgi:D-serine deaminase-like pyridoxal phosphate-dependent protein